MRLMRITMMLLSLSLAVTACKKKEEAPATGSGSSDIGSGSAMATGSGSAAAGSGSAMAAGSGSGASGSGSDSMAGSAAGSGSNMAGSAGSGSDSGSAAAGSGAGSGSADAVAMAHHAGMCPSTVFGATTKVAVKDGKVMVTITSDDKDAIHAIHKRTEESLKEKTDAAGGTGGGNVHDQKGTHGGGIGLCPIHVPLGGKATAKTEAKGVVVTIEPKDPKDADALKTEIDGRIAKAADWVKANIKPGDAKNQGGDGGGSGDHGSNHSGKGNGSGKGDGKGGGSGKGTGGGSAAKK
jgi:hypothetical protein